MMLFGRLNLTWALEVDRVNVLPSVKKVTNESSTGFLCSSATIANTEVIRLALPTARKNSCKLPISNKMGTGKKEKTRKEKAGKGDGMANVKVKGENFYRTGKQAKTLNMFKDGKAQRNASGKVTKAASFQSRDKPKARVEPNRKW